MSVIGRKVDQRDEQMAHDEGSDQPGRPICGHTTGERRRFN